MNTPFQKQTGNTTVDTDGPKLDNASQFTFMARSRVKKAFKKQTKKSIVLFLGLTIFLVSILLFFGIPLLVNFTVLLDSTEDVKSESDTSLEYVPSPSLSSKFLATNSATLTVQGVSDKSYSVKIFNNDIEIDTVDVGNNGKFKTTIKLNAGKNNITAVAISKDKNKSDTSDVLSIQYLNEPPKLEVSTPSENQEFKGDQKFAEVYGTTSEGSKVTINGFWAVMSGNGSFRYSMPLKEGDNPISIISTDQAGNKTEKTFTVKYSQ